MSLKLHEARQNGVTKKKTIQDLSQISTFPDKYAAVSY